MNTANLLLEPSFIKGGIRIVHFIGLALGLGTATFLDLLMLRFMVRNKIRPTHVQAFNFGTRIVTAGLAMLWISGLGFLAYYNLFEPDKLANPKIWAKVSVVGVLTANAVYLHKMVLPLVEQQVSRPLFAGLSIRQRLLMLVGAPPRSPAGMCRSRSAPSRNLTIRSLHTSSGPVFADCSSWSTPLQPPDCSRQGWFRAAAGPSTCPGS